MRSGSRPTSKPKRRRGTILNSHFLDSFKCYFLERNSNFHISFSPQACNNYFSWKKMQKFTFYPSFPAEMFQIVAFSLEEELVISRVDRLIRELGFELIDGSSPEVLQQKVAHHFTQITKLAAAGEDCNFELDVPN